MKRKLVIIVSSLSILLVIGTIISNQQLISYAGQHQVFEQINTAGPEGREAVCRSIHLPWFARQFDVLTPGAMTALLFMVGILIWRKKLELSTTVVRIALGVFAIGLVIMIIYQFVDPFFPFSLCREWLY